MLPPNRQLKKLSEIWVFIRWVSYKKPELLLTYQNWCVTLLRANNIQWNKLDLSEVQYLPNWYTKDEQITKENDILLCMSSGSSHLVGKNVKLQKLNNFSFGAFCSIFRLTKFNDCNIDYLSHCLQWNIYFEYITNISRWAGINNLRNSDLEDFKIPLPPLATQHKIVAKLDEISANIQDSKSKITHEINHLDELWASSLSEAMNNKIWILTKLWALCDFVRWPFWWSLKKEIFKPNWYAIYEQQHAIYNQFSDIRYFIDEDKFNEMKRFELKSWDLIMSCSWTMGKIAIVPEWIKQWIINQALLKLTPWEKINSTFLKLWTQSENFQNNLQEYWQWAAIQNVASVAILKQIQIPLPDLETQKSIVSHLDQLNQTISHIKAEFQSQLAYHDDLWASVLNQAFKGELVKE